MLKYYKRTSCGENSTPSTRDDNSSKQKRVEVNLAELPADPGIRPRIMDYHPNDREKVRRAYLQKGPCQPVNHTFPQRDLGDTKLRRFNFAWFADYRDWLEYSIAKDAAFCLYCYLYKIDNGDQGGGDSFVGNGFRNWRKKSKLQDHIGAHDSSHNKAARKCLDLMNQEQHIETIVSKQSIEARNNYRVRLNASIDCIRFLLKQGLPFRGRDESEDSSNQGNFLELLHFLSNHNEAIQAVTLKNALRNCQMTSPDIQKDITYAAAAETLDVIIKDVGDSLFSILIDESRDVSTKEQMAVALRYVNENGHVIERFIGIEHVTSTTSLSLKVAIENLFSRHGLSMSSLRGQGYDRASNMQGELGGLKTLILNENKCAFFVHCFAHQLQLALVSVAKKHGQIAWFFELVTIVVNVVGASCKRHDTLLEKQATIVFEALESGELQSGRGLNQETSLKRCSDTRWSSHYGTLVSLTTMFTAVIEVLEAIVDDGNSEQRGQACGLIENMHSFDFVFKLHLMRTVLGITNELSQALQRKEQDIVNALKLVELAKERLQLMRDNGWDSLMDQILAFCGKYKIVIPDMNSNILVRGRPRRGANDVRACDYYRRELLYDVVDWQLRELNSRFSEGSSELLRCVACLSPSNYFSAFDKQKLISLARFYPNEFCERDLMVLGDQLDTYIFDMRSNAEFSELTDIGTLAQKMVKTRRNIVYPLVYLLVTLALILPVATATVERAFSAMKIVKSRLRNRMGDQWINDSLIVYIEKDIFNGIDNEAIMQRFQNMKNRRELL